LRGRLRLALASTMMVAACGGGAGTTTATGGGGAGGGPVLEPDAAAGTTSASGGEGPGASGIGGSGGSGGGADTGGGDVGSTGSSSSASGGVEPDFDSIPWQTGDDVGFGVARKDTENPLGRAIFIGYGGYAIGLASTQTWIGALYAARLRDLGVGTVFAVQGPAHPQYTGLEIGNSRVAAALEELAGDAPFVLVLAHSSGSFVAHELLGQLAGGLDPAGVTEGKVVYFDLDGAVSGLDRAIVARLRRAYFVGALDSITGTASPNRGDMLFGAELFPAAGGFLDVDASASGCNAGASWCLHMTPITTLPHDPSDAAGAIDYEDFVGRPVSYAFIDARAEEAGLLP
jgi:hypothetical protein